MGGKKSSLSVPTREIEVWRAFAEEKGWSMAQMVRMAVEHYMRSDRLTRTILMEAAKSYSYEELLKAEGDDGELAAKLIRTTIK